MWLLVIVGLVVLIGVGFIIALVVGVPLSALTVGTQSWAKKQARKMIESGTVDWKNVDRVSKVLSTMSNDLEAKYLYPKLQDLRESQKARYLP
jgi:hypothetical protein